LSVERWADGAPGSRPPEADGGAAGQGCRTDRAPRGGWGGPCQPDGVCRISGTGPAVPGGGEGGSPRGRPAGGPFCPILGGFGGVSRTPENGDFGPFLGGSWRGRKWPEKPRFWAILGPPRKSRILGPGGKNPEIWEISKTETHKFANYLSRLGELLNTLQNVHFFAPPLPKSGISGGVRGGSGRGPKTPQKPPFLGFPVPHQAGPKTPDFGGFGGVSPTRPARAGGPPSGRGLPGAAVRGPCGRPTWERGGPRPARSM
jgi:hypothetical protein